MKFYMILAHNNDCIGLEGVYLEYVKFPMEVYNSASLDEEEEQEFLTLNNMEELHAWAERQFDGDYETVTLDTQLAEEVEGS